MSKFDAFCESRGVKISVKYGVTKSAPEGMEDMNPFRVTLRYAGRQMTVDFFTGRGWTREPNAADVLSCLISDALSIESSGGFEAWARDLGYDTDSRKAEATYWACAKVRMQVRKFLGSDFNAFAEVSNEH